MLVGHHREYASYHHRGLHQLEGSCSRLLFTVLNSAASRHTGMALSGASRRGSNTSLEGTISQMSTTPEIADTAMIKYDIRKCGVFRTKVYGTRTTQLPKF